MDTKTSAANATGIIVFIHGALGNARTTWSSSRSYWPELLTHDATFNGQDIYVHSYPSPAFGRSLSIDELAENLRLMLSTDGVLRYKQISFVCHSMGGVIVRAFILKYQREVVPKVRLLYFFATPTTGSPYAVLASLISPNSQFGELYPLSNPDSYLAPLQSNWLAAHLNLKSYCAYEKLPILGQLVVERESATSLCTERLDPIDGSTHITIVKPLDMNSTAYRALKSAFEETANARAISRPTLPRGSGSHTLPTKEGIRSAIEELTTLGWTVKPGSTDIQFELANRDVPDMRSSAKHLGLLHRSFSIHLQQPKGIGGISKLAGIKDFQRLEISAGEFTDLSEIGALSSISTLSITQVPFNKMSIVDISPLQSLTNLQELYLFGSRVSDLRPLAKLAKLKKLSLNGTLARDIAPLAGLSKLVSLDLTGMQISDLTPLEELMNLGELDISGAQVVDLKKVASLPLSRLMITEQRAADLTPVSELTHLKVLFIWEPPTFNLSFLRKLSHLEELMMVGTSWLGAASTVIDPEAIGDLGLLKKLTINSLNISNIQFVARLRQLTELNLWGVPISSIEALRGLSKLSSVVLNSLPVVEISPLLDVPALQTLNVSRTPARSDLLTELERRGVTVVR